VALKTRTFLFGVGNRWDGSNAREVAGGRKRSGTEHGRAALVHPCCIRHEQDSKFNAIRLRAGYREKYHLTLWTPRHIGIKSSGFSVRPSMIHGIFPSRQDKRNIVYTTLTLSFLDTRFRLVRWRQSRRNFTFVADVGKSDESKLYPLSLSLKERAQGSLSRMPCCHAGGSKHNAR
jgi:hypothetical protein